MTVRRVLSLALLAAAGWAESIGRTLAAAAAGTADEDLLVRLVREHYDAFPGFLDPNHVRRGLFEWEARAYEYLPAAGRVAVIGCGAGRDLLALAPRGYELEGVDISPVLLAEAGRQLGEAGVNAKLYCADVRSFEFPSPPYDAFVFSWFTYAHLPGAARRVEVLRSLGRHLAPAGRLILTYPAWSGPPSDRSGRDRLTALLRRLTGSATPFEPGDRFDRRLYFHHTFRGEEVVGEARSAGLAIVAHLEGDCGVLVLAKGVLDRARDALAPGTRPVGRFGRREALHEHGDEPGAGAGEPDDELPVARDHDLAPAASDRPDHLLRAARRGEDEPARDRVLAGRLEDPGVVDLADLRCDEPGREQRDRDAPRAHLGAERIGERPDGELAHAVRARGGDRHVTRDATDDREPPARPLEVLARAVERAYDSEDVRLELPADVVEGEAVEAAGHAEPGVGDRDVDRAERPAGGGDGLLDVAVDRDVAGDRERLPPEGLDLAGQLGEPVGPPGSQDEVGSAAGELEGERVTDPGRGAGDEDDLVLHRVGHGPGSYARSWTPRSRAVENLAREGGRISTPPESRMSRQIKIASLIWGASILASRLVGLVREMVLGRVLGTSGAADVYMASFVLPDFLNYLLAAGALSIVYIPIFNGYLSRGEERQAWESFSAIASPLLVALVAGVGALWVAVPWLTWIIAPGFHGADAEHLVYLTRIILPAQIFHVFGGLLSATLQARDRHALPALAPLLYTAAVIAGGLIGGSAEGFAWGVLAGSALGPFAIPLAGNRRLGLTFRFTWRWRHPDLATYLRRSLPIMLGFSIVVVDDWIAVREASLVSEGAVAAIRYAKNLLRVPMGIFGMAAGVAAFPTLTRLVAAGRSDDAYRTLSSAVRTVLVLALGSQVVLTVAGPEISEVLYGSRIDADQHRLIGWSLALLGVGLWAWAAQTLVSRGFYAIGRTWPPTTVGTIIAAMAYPLYVVLRHRWGVLGLSAATSIAVSVYIGILVIVLRRSFPGVPDRYGEFALRILPALLAGVLTGWAVRAGVGGPAILRGGAAAVAGGGAYVLVGLLVGPPDVRRLTGMFTSRVRRTRPASASS